MSLQNAQAQAIAVSNQLKNQSLTALVGGFSFAAAIAWMDVARWMISRLVKVPRNGGSHYVLTALMTTLLGIIVFQIVNRFTKVERPKAIQLAVAA